ncbi:hypothetical protein Sjap_020308 [Stephania japonica]|uniref:Uncharacterized protein n=1 Tax=Stephania japonica TaxID=461633 RepID=A0AAP0F164_9MAGN
MTFSGVAKELHLYAKKDTENPNLEPQLAKLAGIELEKVFGHDLNGGCDAYIDELTAKLWNNPLDGLIFSEGVESYIRHSSPELEDYLSPEVEDKDNNDVFEAELKAVQVVARHSWSESKNEDGDDTIEKCGPENNLDQQGICNVVEHESEIEPEPLFIGEENMEDDDKLSTDDPESFDEVSNGEESDGVAFVRRMSTHPKFDKEASIPVFTSNMSFANAREI